MNEKIKLLAEQAGYNVVDGHIKSLRGKEAEKFAELIIRGCADFVQFYYKDHGCEIIAHDMKQHFGVE